jgi:hypothetical protein
MAGIATASCRILAARHFGGGAVGKAVLACAGLVAIACLASREPSSSGGELIPKTSDVDGNAPTLSVSPNGRSLIYQRATSAPDRPDFSLIDLNTQDVRPIALTESAAAAVRARGAVVGWRIGWSRDEGTAFLLSGDQALILAARARPEGRTWELADPRVQKIWLQPESTGRFQVVGAGTNEAKIVDSAQQGLVVASHRRSEGNVVIENLRVSPDETYLAYGVSSGRTFVSPTQGYVLRLDRRSEGRLLAAPLYGAFVWSPIGEKVFGVSREGQARVGIYRWSVDR